jgi:hypothetical protein
VSKTMNEPISNSGGILTPWEAHQARHTRARGIESYGMCVQGPDKVIRDDYTRHRMAHDIRRATVVLWRDDLRVAAMSGASYSRWASV